MFLTFCPSTSFCTCCNSPCTSVFCPAQGQMEASDDLKPQWPLQTPPMAMGHATNHGSNQQSQATLTTTGCAVSHGGPTNSHRSHGQPQATSTTMGYINNRRWSHQWPRTFCQPRVPSMSWGTPTAMGLATNAMGHINSHGSHWLFGLEPLRMSNEG